MKRGRRSVRIEIHKLIMEVFVAKRVPLNAHAIKRILEKEYNKKYSHVTVRKYVKELVKMEKIEIKFTTIAKNGQEFIYYSLKH